MVEMDRTFGIITISCDGCDHEQEFEGFDGLIDFRKAIREAKEDGWKIYIDINGEWAHYCIDCKGK